MIRFVLLSAAASLVFAMTETPAHGTPLSLPGDYNGDGIVSHADYSVLGDEIGQSGTGLAADGNNDGIVSAPDFAIYKAFYGSTASDFAGAAGAGDVYQAFDSSTASLPSVLPFTVTSAPTPNGRTEWIFRFSFGPFLLPPAAIAAHLNITTVGSQIVSATPGPYFLDDTQDPVGVPGMSVLEGGQPHIAQGIGISEVNRQRAFAALGTTLLNVPPPDPISFLRLETSGTVPITLTYSGEYGYLGKDYFLNGTAISASLVLPGISMPGQFEFGNVPSGQWFDPILAPGFRYTMQSASLFTSILQFPPGFNGPFHVTAEGTDLGMFAADQSVDFVSILGHGVSEFVVSGISPTVDATDPTAFPLRIAFNTPLASFQMVAVPEPSALSLMLSILLITRVSRIHRSGLHSHRLRSGRNLD